MIAPYLCEMTTSANAGVFSSVAPSICRARYRTEARALSMAAWVVDVPDQRAFRSRPCDPFTGISQKVWKRLWKNPIDRPFLPRESGLASGLHQTWCVDRRRPLTRSATGAPLGAALYLNAS